MEKDIKDYAHLYLGCEALVQFPEDTDGIRCIIESVNVECISFNNIAPDYYFDEPECGFMPILRRLSSMTEEEAKDLTDHGIEQLHDAIHLKTHTLSFTPEDLLYLLSEGFDIFGLIDANLAIDKDTI